MTSDRIAALDALLAQAETAHGVYETTELDGVYDDAWPRWYAQWAVDHGIAELLGHPVGVDELADVLATRWDERTRAGGRPSEPWPALTARDLAETVWPRSG